MTEPFTMEKWNQFELILKDNELQELLNKIYLNKDIIDDKNKEMK